MDNASIKNYAFILGRERELCLAELKAVLGRFCFGFNISSVTDNVIFINIDKGAEDVAKLSKALGGTIKIFEVIGNSGDLKTVITNYIKENVRSEGRMTFGISAYEPEHLNLTIRNLNQLGFKMKKELKALDISSRFLELKDSKEVSTILSLKEKLIGKGLEFGIFPNVLGVLIGLSNPEEWNIRDYEKPAGDKYSGMLPPKLARIMVNLALGHTHSKQIQYSKIGEESKQVVIPAKAGIQEDFDLDSGSQASGRNDKDGILVIDPFCGSGNVLTEALMLGCSVFGSDISDKSVSDSIENIEWLASKYQIEKPEFKVVKADATGDDFCSLIGPSKCRLAIVTEPYLGEPKKFKPSKSATIGEYRKIAEMYLAFFKNFSKLKSDNPVFCVVFPLIETIEGRRFSVYRECVDEIKKIGYTELQSPLIYGRDYQVVKREISLLTLN